MRRLPGLQAALLALACPAFAGQVFVYESDASGLNAKTYFFDTGKAVLAVDAQLSPELAGKALDFLRSKTSSPLAYVVVTQPSADKFLGLGSFQRAGAKAVMSKRTRDKLQEVYDYQRPFLVDKLKAFSDRSYPPLPKPDKTFDDGLVLKLKGDETAVLTELGMPGASSNHTLVLVQAAKSLFVGDLVQYKVHAWLEGPIEKGRSAYSTDNWVSALEELKKRFKDVTVYGGRGQEAPISAAVDDQIAYLRKADTIARDYVDEIEGPDLASKKAKASPVSLSRLFEAEFEDRPLIYLVPLSAHGLLEGL